jgi:Ca2+/Na+ antiporter
MIPPLFGLLIPNILIMIMIIVFLAFVRLRSSKKAAEVSRLIQIMFYCPLSAAIGVILCGLSSFWLCLLYIPLTLFIVYKWFSTEAKVWETKNGDSGLGCLFFLVFSLSVIVFVTQRGLRDWYRFQGEVQRVTVEELPQKRDVLYIVPNATVIDQYTGTHSWVTTDSEGDTTTHTVYYAPLVDIGWTKDDEIAAWVDVEGSYQWTGRLERKDPGENHWVAVSNAKSRHGLKGVGQNEAIYRIVPNDTDLIEDVNFGNLYLKILIGVFLLISGVLFLVNRPYYSQSR